MKQISLTRGHVALVSDCDYAYLMRSVWHSSGKRASPYAVSSDGKLYMHHVVARRKGLKGQRIDHANQNTLDNQRRNLRAATRPQNAWNSRRPVNNTSGIKNVSFDKQTGKFAVRVKRHGKQIWLGRHPTRKAAEKCARDFVAKHDGAVAAVAEPFNSQGDLP